MRYIDAGLQDAKNFAYMTKTRFYILLCLRAFGRFTEWIHTPGKGSAFYSTRKVFDSNQFVIAVGVLHCEHEFKR